ncbi:hypothetical protein [Hydrocoleum sp. CS-953]|uniref:hypothetical protein n=1 Tax=Hydrocoleum sp. CS-953 TaxID=1671698 RepID=UPI00143DBE31|nr:hypothetical protein [Hydrocoleum sp. CS-953]
MPLKLYNIRKIVSLQPKILGSAIFFQELQRMKILVIFHWMVKSDHEAEGRSIAS